MSKQEIIDKWLFVAYSEKKNNTYRDNIKFRRNYAGAKGVGRFSCDRLGETVELLSKVIIGEVDGKAVQFDQQLCDALRKKLLSYENILDEMYMFIESNF